MRVFDLFPTAWALALAQSLQPYICPFICFMLTSQLSGHLKMSNRAICVEDWPAIDQLIYYYLPSASPPRPALYNWRVYLMMIKETGPFGAFKIIHIHLCVCVCVCEAPATHLIILSLIQYYKLCQNKLQIITDGNKERCIVNCM